MGYKSLGVIQIDLPEITLPATFGAGEESRITSFLSEEQKKMIIQAIKGEKIVFCSFAKITDNTNDYMNPHSLVPCYRLNKSEIISQVLISNGGNNFSIDLYLDGDNFILYS